MQALALGDVRAAGVGAAQVNKVGSVGGAPGAGGGIGSALAGNFSFEQVYFRLKTAVGDERVERRCGEQFGELRRLKKVIGGVAGNGLRKCIGRGDLERLVGLDFNF